MAYTAGTAFVRVLPSLSDFQRKLREELSGVNESVKVDVRPVVESAALTAVRADLDEIGRISVTPKVDVSVTGDVSGIRGELQALDGKTYRPRLELDGADQVTADLVAAATKVKELDGAKATATFRMTGATPAKLQEQTVALRDLREELRQIDGVNAQAQLRVGGVTPKRMAQQVTALQGLREELRQLDGLDVRIHVEVTGSTAALAEMAALAAAATALGGMSPEISPRVNASGVSAGAKAVQVALSSVLGPLGSVTTGLGLFIAIGGGVAAALGLIGGAFAALPALALAGGAAIGVVALGIDGLKKAAAAAQPELNGLKAAVSGEFAKSMTPVFDQLGSILPRIQTQVVGVASGVTGLARSFTEVAASSTGVTQMNGVLGDTHDFLIALQPAVRGFATDLLSMASAGSPALVDLGNALSRAQAEFHAMITAAIASGSFQEAILGFNSALQELIGLLTDVVGVGIEVGAAVNGELAGAIAAFSGLLEPLAPVLASVGVQLLNLVTTLATSLAPVFAAIMPVLISLVDTLGPILQGVIQALAPALVPLITGLAQLLAGLLPLLAPIGQLVAVMGTLLGQALSALAPLISAVASTISDVLTAALAALQPILPVIVSAFQQATAAVLPMVPVFGQVATMIITSLLPVLPLVAQAMASIAGAVVGALMPVLPTLANAFVLLVTALSPLIPLIAEIVSTAISALAPVLSIVADAFLQIVQAVTPVLPPIMQLVQALLPPLAAIIAALMPIVSALADAFVQIFAALIPILPPVAQLVTAMLPLLSTLLTAVATVASAILVPAIQLLSTILSSVVGFFVTLGGTIVTWVANVIQWFNDFGTNVSAVWAAIQTAVSTAWTTYVQPVLSGIQTAVTAVGDALNWLWVNIVQPVFAAISQAAQILLAVVVTAVLTPIMVAANLLGQAFQALYDNVIAPVWSAIQTAISTAWNFIRDNIFTPISTFLTATLGPVFTVFGTTASTVWTGIQNVINTVWTFIRDVIWTPIVTFIQTVLSPVFVAFQTTATTVWTAVQNVISTVWAAIQSIFSSAIAIVTGAWNTFWGSIQSVASTVFGAVRSTIETVTGAIQTAFQTVVDRVGQIWSTIKGLLAKPINFMIDVVYNNGIVKAWNFVADLLPGVEPIGTLPLIPEMATGGRVGGSKDASGGGRITGPGTGTSDSILAISPQGLLKVSNHEFIVNAKQATRHASFLEALNSGQAEAVQAAGGRGASMPGYAAGGEIGARITNAQRIAQAMNGKPYVWGGASASGADCSGYQSIITNALRGVANPYSRVGTTANFPWIGFQSGLGGSYAVGAFHGNPGHMAGTLAGVNVESGGSHGNVAYGGPAVGADSGQFNIQAFLPEVGGVFASGGGGGGSLINWILEQVRKVYDEVTSPIPALIRQLVGDPPPQFKAIPPQVADKVIKDVGDFLFGQADAAGAGGAPGTGPVMDQVRQAAMGFGWGDGPQWDALAWIISKESGWNPTAQNPSSTAYGLFQFLDATWASTGIAKTDNPGLQAQAGMRYIQQRYGTPVQARAFWEANGHYDKGGMAVGRGLMMKDVIQPERVLSARQTVAFETLVDNLDRGYAPTDRFGPGFRDGLDDRGGRGRGDAPLIGTLHQTLTPGASANDFADEAVWAMRTVRRGGGG